jgi:hypothetical protein
MTLEETLDGTLLWHVPEPRRGRAATFSARIATGPPRLPAQGWVCPDAVVL